MLYAKGQNLLPLNLLRGVDVRGVRGARGRS